MVNTGFGGGKEGEEKKCLPFERLKHSCAYGTETDMQYICGSEILWAGAMRKIMSEKASGGGWR